MDESSIEDWNMAKAYLMRIDQLLTTCDICQTRDDMMGWYKALYSLFKEIYPKLKPAEQQKTRELLDELIKLKNDALKDGQIIRTTPFVDFELHLRQHLEDRHLITPKRDLSGL